jgi:hypothetical protein
MGMNPHDPAATGEQARAEGDTRSDTGRTGPYAGGGDDLPALPPSAPPDFEILGELGRGGMGVVYKARQVSLNRLCALKMILSGAHATEPERRRFLAEGEAVAALHHPNIVGVYQSGTHEGLPWFALEFCGGGSLSRRLREGPMPPPEAARLVELLAHAVQAAHAAGIIHRDLKPANVLLDEAGAPRVADFGLARRADSDGPTGTNAVMGTPSYMAPEQAGGHSREAGPAADVWALGAILYGCLTGRPPFKGATAAETLLRVLNEEPAPPPGPRDLVTICLKCLRKEPGRRYASADALAEDLRRWSASEPITARPVGAAERLWLWARRRPGVAALVALVAVSLVGGTAGSVAFAVRSARNASEANENLAKLEVSVADGLLRPLGQQEPSYPLTDQEMESLNELAEMPAERSRVRRLFLFRPLARPGPTRQLSRRLGVALHAAVGLDRRWRDELSAEIAGRLRDEEDEPGVRLLLARMLAALEAPSDEAPLASRLLLAGIGETVPLDERDQLAVGLDQLARHLPEAELLARIAEVEARLRLDKASAPHHTLLRCLGDLVEALPAPSRTEAALRAARLICDRTETFYGAPMSVAGRTPWMACLARLAPFLPPGEGLRAALLCVESLPKDDGAGGCKDAVVGVAQLGEALPPPDAEKLVPPTAKWLTARAASAEDRDIVWAARALAPLAGMPGGPAKVEAIADPLARRAAQMKGVAPGPDPLWLLDALVAAAPFMSPPAAESLRGKALTLFMAEAELKTPDPTSVQTAARVYVALTSRAGPGPLKDTEDLASLVSEKQPDGRHGKLCQMLAAVLARMPATEAAESARKAARGLVDQLAPTPNPVLASEVGGHLGGLLARLPAGEASALARRLADTLARHPDPDLANDLCPVIAGFSNEEETVAVAGPILDGLVGDDGKSAADWIEALASLSGRLSPIRGKTTAGLLNALRRWPTLGKAHRACDALVVLGDGEARSAAADILLGAARKAEKPVDLIAILKALATLSTSLDDGQREAALEVARRGCALVDPLRTPPSHGDFVALVLRLAGPDRDGARRRLLAYTRTHLDAARGLGPETAPLLGRLDADDLRAVLRHPCCVGPTRDRVLAECSRRAGRKLATLWDAVDWLDAGAR